MTKLKTFLKNITLPKTIDFLLVNFSLFLLLFVWSKFIFKRNYFLSFLLTFACLVGWNIIYFTLKLVKKSPSVSSKDTENWAQYVLSQNEEDNLKLLISLYQQKFSYTNNSQNNAKSSSLSLNNTNDNSNQDITILSNNLFLLPTNVGIAFDFFESDISLVRSLKIVRLAKEKGISKLAIFCVNYTPKTKMFLENLEGIEVQICDKSCLSLKTKKAGLTPPNVLREKTPHKLKFKEFISISLAREKAKKYFFSGLLIFFCSLIVKNSIYYVLMSSFLFLLSILSLRQKTPQVKNNFWE